MVCEKLWIERGSVAVSVPAEEELTELRRRAVAGDEAAMSALLGAVQPLVARRCSRILPCSLDAEEATQDALVAVSRHLGTFDESRGSFLGWLTVIASNCARSTYRSLKRRAAERTMEYLPETYDPRTTSVIAGSRLDLLDALEELEASHPQMLQPFVLRDLGSLPYQEIADHLDLPIGTVKAQIHSARQFVRDRLVDRLT